MWRNGIDALALVKVTLKEQDEQEEYFESYQKELLEIKAQIGTIDKQIDEMVYALYGLSEDEVAVVGMVEVAMSKVGNPTLRGTL